mgnify:FL=1
MLKIQKSHNGIGSNTKAAIHAITYGTARLYLSFVVHTMIDCWGGSRFTDDVLDDNGASSLRYGSEHDESERSLSIISFLSLLAALISLNRRRLGRGQ